MTLVERKPLRQQLSINTQIGEQARDMQNALDTIPLMVTRKVTGMYREPIVLGALRAPPVAIEAIRVVDATETPVKCGGLCHFVYKPEQGGALINSIDGMSLALNGGKQYTFSFRITYEGA